MNSYNGIFLSPKEDNQNLDFDSLPRLESKSISMNFLTPKFLNEKNFDENFIDTDSEEYRKALEEKKLFHSNFDENSLFSSKNNIDNICFGSYKNLDLQMVFKEADFDKLPAISHSNVDADKNDISSRDDLYSRRVQRIKTRRMASVLKVDEVDTYRRKRVRQRHHEIETLRQDVAVLQGSTRLEAKRRRRLDNLRTSSIRHTKITESEFLGRRECVDRKMIVREKDGINQIAVLEDGLLVEHYVADHNQCSSIGNVYLGRVQNVLPSMEAAFVDIGKDRNAVLYAGEVNWDELGLEGNVRRIENALKPGDIILVQVTKDPIGHKGARLTSQVTLAGRHVVLVPSGAMTGISKKLPEEERIRLKKLLHEIVPDDYGVIVRTAAEGASAKQIEEDVNRLVKIWENIELKQKQNSSPMLVHGEIEVSLRVIRDVFNDDFNELVVSGEKAWQSVSKYVEDVSPDLSNRLIKWVDERDVFEVNRVDEQLAKGMDRKVWLPSGGYLIIDRTEAMTVIDVNTGKYIGSGGTLEETITKNNLESAEEIVRQLRLRDIGGIIVIDFVDMVLQSNRYLVHRRLIECLGRDRTRHQVTEVTSLGLVQMTRKRIGQGLVEVFSSKCECCDGRGYIIHDHPVVEESDKKSNRKFSKKDKHQKSDFSKHDFNASKHSKDEEKSNTNQSLNVTENNSSLKYSHFDGENDANVSASDSSDVSVASISGSDHASSDSSFSSQENFEATESLDEIANKPVATKRVKRKRVVSSGTFSDDYDKDSSIIII